MEQGRTSVDCTGVSREDDDGDTLFVEPPLPFSHLETDEQLAKACMCIQYGHEATRISTVQYRINDGQGNVASLYSRLKSSFVFSVMGCRTAS